MWMSARSYLKVVGEVLLYSTILFAWLVGVSYVLAHWCPWLV